MILLVEDSEDDVFLMQRALRKAGITRPMQCVANGQEALDYVKGAHKFADRTRHPLPEVIFLDLKLPYVHGFEVLRQIREMPHLNGINVAVLSSSLEETDHERAKALGASRFFVKPPAPEILAEFFKSIPPQ